MRVPGRTASRATAEGSLLASQIAGAVRVNEPLGHLLPPGTVAGSKLPHPSAGTKLAPSMQPRRVGAAVVSAALLLSGFLDAGSAEIVYRRREEQLFLLFLAENACSSTELYSTQNSSELHCPAQWDTIGCWPSTAAGSFRAIPCPSYINMFETEAATLPRACLANGSWEEEPGKNRSLVLTERYQPCFASPWVAEGAMEVPSVIQNHLPIVLIIYDVGYSISTVALVLAITLMWKLKKLRCPRNTIHIHLFASFLLRAVMTLLNSHLLAGESSLSSSMVEVDGMSYYSPNASHWECKLLTTATHYALGTNFMWIFIEGLYLHMLMFATHFTDTSGVKGFIIGGWLGPLLYIIPYTIVRIHVDDNECWSNYADRNLRWIVEGPMAVTIIINFGLFLNIVRVLATKLRAPHAKGDRKNMHRKLAKSTLVLIPLFGVHWIVFLALDVYMDAGAEVARFYFDTLLTSFQGLAVSLLFCFCNSEVQAELKKKWRTSWCANGTPFCRQARGVHATVKSSGISMPTEASMLRDSRRNTPVDADGTAEDQRSPADERQRLVAFAQSDYKEAATQKPGLRHGL